MQNIKLPKRVELFLCSNDLNTIDNLYRVSEPRRFITTNIVFIYSYYL